MLRNYLDDDRASAPTPRPPSPDAAHFGGGDIGWQALSPAIACTLLSTLIVAARWYTRSRLAHSWGTDDLAITLSLLMSWALTVVIGVEVKEGVGDYSGQRHVSRTAKLVVVANSLWVLTVNLTKSSILIQYLRIFKNRRTTFICYGLLAALIPATIWGILGGIFLCSPIAKLWAPNTPGHCRSAQGYWLSVAGIDIGLDFVVLLLPLPAIGALRLGRRQKLGLVLFFLLGFAVCTFSVARLVTVQVTAGMGDFVVSGVWAIIWSTVGANVGIICASLLAIKTLIERIFPALFTTNSDLPSYSTKLPPIIDAEKGWAPADSVATTMTTAASPSTVTGLERAGSEQTWPSVSKARTHSGSGRYTAGRHFSKKRGCGAE